MKLTKQTLSILTNFSEINQSILFQKGNQLRTISVMKNILAEAEIKEEFPKDFAIYDLPQFLKVLRLYQDPELDFSDGNYVTIREGRNRSRYFFADPNVIVSPPEKKLTLPSEDVTFEITPGHLSQLLQAANTLDLPDLAVIGEAGVIRLSVRDKKNDTSNDHSIVVGETDKEFVFNFKVENIKILPGNYKVSISSKCLSQFTNVLESQPLTYFIALEPDSEFNS
ncbi:DNA polymerase processivity factor [Synechococcus phage S-T4]|jgi:hypothetical protein|uniref:Sliding clamp n=1 Tax=Synechococcus phage S-T4 TaxID=2268578 RepID=A0A385EHK1_9CAUD|nr:DNA polymerase processivity factor [Synechococcus phage S-T4]AXQ70558.1 sliding clamp DNA polymerase accessory protein [Synechococcus phage S-T4]